MQQNDVLKYQQSVSKNQRSKKQDYLFGVTFDHFWSKKNLFKASRALAKIDKSNRQIKLSFSESLIHVENKDFKNESLISSKIVLYVIVVWIWTSLKKKENISRSRSYAMLCSAINFLNIL